jgi:hypothetical protein
LSSPPETVEHYISDSIARVQDLSARQRQALKGELMRTMGDIGFLRTLMDSAKARGPWSAEAVHPTDEGKFCRPIGRFLSFATVVANAENLPQNRTAGLELCYKL